MPLALSCLPLGRFEIPHPGKPLMQNITSIAASRLIAQQRALDVTADNIANAGTPGYKAVRMQFSDWLSRQSGAATPRGGATVAYTQDRATWRDFQAGPLTHTGNPLDIALTGSGYFTVSTAQGPKLTRAGRFGLLPDGTIADGTGNALLNANGQPIQLSPTDTQITIAGDGTISSENGQIAKVGVVEVGDPMQLQGVGGDKLTSGSATSQSTNPGLVQGSVEDSNVQPMQEMVRMMNDLREFQYVTQMVESEDQRQQSAIDKITQHAS
jgi:flagellar basal-body rod protein FlgF